MGSTYECCWNRRSILRDFCNVHCAFSFSCAVWAHWRRGHIFLHSLLGLGTRSHHAVVNISTAYSGWVVLCSCCFSVVSKNEYMFSFLRVCFVQFAWTPHESFSSRD